MRSDISKRNKHWISKHRYYELKHFCLQYPEWKQEVKNFNYILEHDVNVIHNDGMRKEYISDQADRLSKALSKIRLVEETCKEVDDLLWDYILKSVTEGTSYETLRMAYEIPCSRVSFYGRYRKFFYILSQKLQLL